MMYALSTHHGRPRIWMTLLSFVCEMHDATREYSLESISITSEKSEHTIIANFKKKIKFNSIWITMHRSWIDTFVVQCERFFDVCFRCKLNIRFHSDVFYDVDAFFTIWNVDTFEKLQYIFFRHSPLKSACHYHVKARSRSRLFCIGFRSSITNFLPFICELRLSTYSCSK